MKGFFLKVWAKNMGAHYTQQNTVCALPVNQTCDLWVYGTTLQPTESHQPGQNKSFKKTVENNLRL